MILDTVLTRLVEARNFLVQPTDNTFAALSEFSKKLHDAMVKVTEFTTEVINQKEQEEEVVEEERKPKKKKKDREPETEPEPEKPTKQSKTDAKAEELLNSKLEECYKFRDELRDLAAVPIAIVSRINRAAQIKTDTPPEIVGMGLRLLLLIMNRFLETVNHDDPRNSEESATTDPNLEHPHAKLLAGIVAGSPQVSASATRNKVTAATPRPKKTITRTLTRPR